MQKNKNDSLKGLKPLIKAFTSLQTNKECEDFLYDIFTPAELQSLRDRLEVAERILKGESYRSIAQATRCSTATITRVGRTLKYGRQGYQKVLTPLELK
jgi:TrpR-related protein YerC/YecD